MNIQLETLEARIIGCLIEKQITTPDQYPLSLNSLTLACNQKSNRDPLMSVSDAEVQATLDKLAKRHLVVEKSGFGSRVPKYQHRFCNTEYGTLKFTPHELAVVCELLLRGPQTPGELRSRASRMAPFADVAEIENALTQLVHRGDGPFAVRLAREAGRRDSRYAQLFTGETHVAATEADDLAAESQAPSSSSGGGSRLDKLEAEVRAMREELDALKRQLGGP